MTITQVFDEQMIIFWTWKKVVFSPRNSFWLWKQLQRQTLYNFW